MSNLTDEDLAYIESLPPAQTPELSDDDLAYIESLNPYQTKDGRYIVKDGDTIEDSQTGQVYRLAGIDTTETGKPFKGVGGQRYSDDARTRLTNMLDAAGSENLRFTEVDTDKYGRTVARIEAPFGDLSAKLIEDGFAGQFMDDEGRYNQARANQNGNIDNFLSVYDQGALTPEEQANLESRMQNRKYFREGTLNKAILRGTDSSQMMLYGAADAIGQQFGLPELQQWATQGIERNQQEIAENPPEIMDFDEVHGIGDFGTYALEAIGEQLPNFGIDAVAALGTGGIAAVGGALARRQALRSLFNSYAKKGGVAGIYAQTTGETQLGLKEEGIESPETAFAVGGFKAGLEYVGLKSILGGLSKTTGIPRGDLLAMARDISARAGVSAITEGSTEGAQTVLDYMAVGLHAPDYDMFSDDNLKGLREAILKGAIVGGAARGTGETGKAALDKLFAAPVDTSQAVPESDQAVPESDHNISNSGDIGPNDQNNGHSFVPERPEDIAAQTQEMNEGRAQAVITPASNPEQQAVVAENATSEVFSATENGKTITSPDPDLVRWWQEQGATREADAVVLNHGQNIETIQDPVVVTRENPDGSRTSEQAVERGQLELAVTQEQAKATPDQQVIVEEPAQSVQRRLDDPTAEQLSLDFTQATETANEERTDGILDDAGRSGNVGTGAAASTEERDGNQRPGSVFEGGEGEESIPKYPEIGNRAGDERDRRADERPWDFQQTQEVAEDAANADNLSKILETVASGKSTEAAKAARKIRLRTQQIQEEARVPWQEAQAYAIQEMVAKYERSQGNFGKGDRAIAMSDSEYASEPDALKINEPEDGRNLHAKMRDEEIPFERTSLEIKAQRLARERAIDYPTFDFKARENDGLHEVVGKRKIFPTRRGAENAIDGLKKDGSDGLKSKYPSSVFEVERVGTKFAIVEFVDPSSVIRGGKRPRTPEKMIMQGINRARFAARAIENTIKKYPQRKAIQKPRLGKFTNPEGKIVELSLPAITSMGMDLNHEEIGKVNEAKAAYSGFASGIGLLMQQGWMPDQTLFAGGGQRFRKDLVFYVRTENDKGINFEDFYRSNRDFYFSPLGSDYSFKDTEDRYEDRDLITDVEDPGERGADDAPQGDFAGGFTYFGEEIRPEEYENPKPRKFNEATDESLTEGIDKQPRERNRSVTVTLKRPEKAGGRPAEPTPAVKPEKTVEPKDNKQGATASKNREMTRITNGFAVELTKTISEATRMGDIPIRVYDGKAAEVAYMPDGSVEIEIPTMTLKDNYTLAAILFHGLGQVFFRKKLASGERFTEDQNRRLQAAFKRVSGKYEGRDNPFEEWFTDKFVGFFKEGKTKTTNPLADVWQRARTFLRSFFTRAVKTLPSDIQERLKPSTAFNRFMDSLDFDALDVAATPKTVQTPKAVDAPVSDTEMPKQEDFTPRTGNPESMADATPPPNKLQDELREDLETDHEVAHEKQGISGVPAYEIIGDYAKYSLGKEKDVYVLDKKVRKDHARMVHRIIKLFGLADGRKIILGSHDTFAEIEEDLRGRGLEKGTSAAHDIAVQISAFTKNSQSHAAVLPRKDAVYISVENGPHVIYYLAHEIGHLFYRSKILDLATETEKKALENAFEYDKKNPEINWQYTDVFVGFEEWIADKFAAWIKTQITGENKATENLVTRAFRRIYAQMRRAFIKAIEIIDPYTVKRMAPSAEFDKLMDRLVKEHDVKMHGGIAKSGGAAAMTRAPLQRAIRENFTRDNIESFARRGKDIATKGLKGLRPALTADRQLRRIHTALANMWWQQTSTDAGGKTGLFNILPNKRGVWLEQLHRLEDQIKQEHGEEALALAYQGLQSGEERSVLIAPAQKLGEFLDAFHDYLSPRIKTIGRLENYFPRMWDIQQINERPQEFIDMLETLGYNNGEEIKANILNEGGLDTERFKQAIGPGFKSGKTRSLLGPEVDSVARNAGFLYSDPQAIVEHYLLSGVRRAEYEDRFGGHEPVTEFRPLAGIPEGMHEMVSSNNLHQLGKYMESVGLMPQRWEQHHQWQDLVMTNVDEAINQGYLQWDKTDASDTARWYNPNAKLNKMLNEIIDPNERRRAENILDAYMGRIGQDMDPQVRKAMSGLLVYESYLTLMFSAVASLPDFAGPILNAKDFQGMKQAFRTYVHTAKNRQEAITRAKELGTIQRRMTNQALLDMYGQAHTSAFAQKAMEKLFHWNGQEMVTNASRILATAVGEQFIVDHAYKAQQGDATSASYLKELAIDPNTVIAWKESGAQAWNFRMEGVEADNALAVQQAIGHFVDNSIVRPNAAQRPIWASDPRWMLIWHLKSFFYSYGKVIMGGLAREVANRYRRADGNEAKKAIFASLPVVAAGMLLLPLAAAGLEARELIQYWGEDPTERLDSLDYMAELTSRAGIYGPLELGAAFFGVGSYDAGPITLAGPTIQHIQTIISAPAEIGIKRSLPVFNQNPALWDAVKEVF